MGDSAAFILADQFAEAAEAAATTTAAAAAIPVDDPRVSYVLGRQSCDTRSMEPSGVDVGNAQFGGQEVTVVLDDVFVPYDRVFMDRVSQDWRPRT